MSDDDLELERGIKTYVDRMRAEAELARSDVEEVEDHLRELARDLHAGGAPISVALEAAQQRVGDPAEIARELARVRSVFGARLSRLRAWSASALLAPFAFLSVVDVARGGNVTSPSALETALGTSLLLGVVLRLSWARMFVFGSAIVSALSMAVWSTLYAAPASITIRIVCFAGAAAFLAPWRRMEMSRAGASLALMGPAYAAAGMLLFVHLTPPAPVWVEAVTVALVLVGSFGGLIRARWAPVALFTAGLAIVVCMALVWPLQARVPHAGIFRATILATLGLGVACAWLSAFFARASARTWSGTLRGLRV